MRTRGDIHRYERAERFERNAGGKGVVLEADARKWISALKRRFAKARQARHEIVLETEGADEGRKIFPLEHARRRRAALRMRADGEKRARERVSLARAVEQLPVLQIAAPAQRDRAGPDAAERKGDLRERGTAKCAYS
jgi:hypothetical protein